MDNKKERNLHSNPMCMTAGILRQLESCVTLNYTVVSCLNSKASLLMFSDTVKGEMFINPINPTT